MLNKRSKRLEGPENIQINGKKVIAERRQYSPELLFIRISEKMGFVEKSKSGAGPSAHPAALSRGKQVTGKKLPKPESKEIVLFYPASSESELYEGVIRELIGIRIKMIIHKKIIGRPGNGEIMKRKLMEMVL